MVENPAENPDCPAIIQDYAIQAVAYVKRALGFSLEYDSETLPVLDHYLRQAIAQGPVATLVVLTTAAYFGEVVRRHLGGHWEVAGQEVENARVVLPGGLSFSPAELVQAAVERDDGDTEQFRIPPKIRPILESALERMEPVTEDVYYSLCGRLDTLEHLQDVLLASAAARMPN